MHRSSRSSTHRAPALKVRRQPPTLQVIVPLESSRGSTLKDYVGQSVDEIREGFQHRKNQSLDQAVLTGEVVLRRGRIVFSDPE